MHYFKTGDGVLVNWPQISPPFLPAPPFTFPVVVEGKFYLAQETFGTAYKQTFDVHTYARALKKAWLRWGGEEGVFDSPKWLPVGPPGPTLFTPHSTMPAPLCTLQPC